MIYKFSPPSEYALANLVSGALYCRHFEEFNDPFELWYKLESGLPILDDTDNRFQKAVAAWGFPGSRKEDLPLDEETWRDYFGGLAEGAPLFIFDQTRITCFCSEVNNLLMWSHYADGLRGFCIEFDEAEIINEDEQTFLVQANYTDRPPVIDSLVYAVTKDQFEYALEHGYDEYEGELRRIELNEILRTAVASKPKEWQYEKEVRLIVKSSEENRNAILYKYPSHSIKSVILGEKSSIDFKAKIRDVLADLNLPIKVKVATRSKNAYQILIQNIEL